MPKIQVLKKGVKTHELAQKWQAKFKEITNNGGNGQEMYELREELGSQNRDNMGIFRTQEKLDLLAKNLRRYTSKI